MSKTMYYSNKYATIVCECLLFVFWHCTDRQ